MIGISVAANKEWNYIREYIKGSTNRLSAYIYGEYLLIVLARASGI